MSTELNLQEGNIISFSNKLHDKNSPPFTIAQNDEMNIKTNNEYHEQGLAQANISFYYSLAGGGIGFLVLIISVFVLNDKQAYVGVVSGIIIDAISAIFFKISSDASKARTAYFDKLRDDTKRRDSLMLCNSVEDSKTKDSLKVKLSLYFAGLDEKKICSQTIGTCTQKDSQNTV